MFKNSAKNNWLFFKFPCIYPNNIYILNFSTIFSAGSLSFGKNKSQEFKKKTYITLFLYIPCKHYRIIKNSTYEGWRWSRLRPSLCVVHRVKMMLAKRRRHLFPSLNPVIPKKMRIFPDISSLSKSCSWRYSQPSIMRGKIQNTLPISFYYSSSIVLVLTYSILLYPQLTKTIVWIKVA